MEFRLNAELHAMRLFGGGGLQPAVQVFFQRLSFNLPLISRLQYSSAS